jgi:release factor glutamine methyltransferase
MTPAEVVRRAARYLAAHGVESPEQNAEVLLRHVLNTDRAGLYARRDGLNTAEARAYGRALCQRCKGTPLQHLVGTQPFMGLDLRVEPGVFVPRPETESLVEAALDVVAEVKSPTVVDVGTGTGGVALAMKHLRPDARVIATDVSEAAVTLARANAARLGIEVEVLEGSLLDPVPIEVRGGLDLLVSNPPYVTVEEYESLPVEVRADPYQALVGGTGLHGRLAELAVTWLRPGGWLVAEIGAAQGPEVAALFRAGLSNVEVLADLAGRDRVVRGQRLRRDRVVRGQRPEGDRVARGRPGGPAEP